MSRTRRIWIIADPHIGHVSDGRDGGEWLELVMRDRQDAIGPVDYAMNLGDLSHGYQAEQFARYARLRERSGIGRWLEVVGNHDFRGLLSGDYQRIVGCPRYWSLVDGNLAILNLPAERGNAAGLLIPPVEQWLRAMIESHSDKIIAIAAHQFPYDTVAHSTLPPRYLYPRACVERFLHEVRIDAWLGGHVHSAPRTADCSAARNGTVFINAASASHTYNTGACNSVLLELTAGSRRAVVRVRDHDRGQWLADQEVEVSLARAWAPPLDGPVVSSFDLDVPAHYSRIEEEQVERF